MSNACRCPNNSRERERVGLGLPGDLHVASTSTLDLPVVNLDLLDQNQRVSRTFSYCLLVVVVIVVIIIIVVIVITFISHVIISHLYKSLA